MISADGLTMTFFLPIVNNPKGFLSDQKRLFTLVVSDIALSTYTMCNSQSAVVTWTILGLTQRFIEYKQELPIGQLFKFLLYWLRTFMLPTWEFYQSKDFSEISINKFYSSIYDTSG